MTKAIKLEVDIWSDTYNEAALEAVKVEIRSHLVEFIRARINAAPIGDGVATNNIDHRFEIDGTIKIVDRK